MQKINVLPIIKDHIYTLRNAKTGNISKIDILFFYLTPVFAGLYAPRFGIIISDSAINTFISIFAIFSALLFSAQIALYGLKPEAPKRRGDAVSDDLLIRNFNEQKKYISYVNSNVSYLILISCVTLFVFAVFTVIPVKDYWKTLLSSFFAIHFFLTLVMLIKRTHVAFKLGHERE